MHVIELLVNMGVIAYVKVWGTFELVVIVCDPIVLLEPEALKPLKFELPSVLQVNEFDPPMVFEVKATEEDTPEHTVCEDELVIVGLGFIVYV